MDGIKEKTKDIAKILKEKHREEGCISGCQDKHGNIELSQITTRALWEDFVFWVENGEIINPSSKGLEELLKETAYYKSGAIHEQTKFTDKEWAHILEREKMLKEVKKLREKGKDEKESFKEFLETTAMNVESGLGPDPQTCEHAKKRERVYPLTDLKELMERDSSRLWVFELVMSGKLDVTPFGIKVLKCSNCDELLPIREEINATRAGELIRLAVEGCTLKAPQGFDSEPQPLPWEIEDDDGCNHLEVEGNPSELRWIRDYWLAEWGREETVENIKKGIIKLDLDKRKCIDGVCVECDGLAPITDPCTEEEANAKLEKALAYLERKDEKVELFYRKEEEPNLIGTSEETVEKVVHPGHYQLGELGIEAMDVMRAVLTREEMQGFYKANAIKYILRANKKNGLEDIKKAHYYLNELLKEEEDEVKNNIY